MSNGVATAPLVRCGQEEISTEDLQVRAARGAAALVALGVARGDRVALVVRNEPRFLEATMAIALAGAVPVPINVHWTPAEIGHVLADSDCAVVFAHSGLVPVVEATEPARTIIELVEPAAVAAAFGLSPAASGAHLEYEAWLSGATPLREPVEGAPMSLIYTSGTTGTPKGVVRDPVSPDRAGDLAQLLCEGLAFEPGMRTLIPAPLYHTAPNAHALFAVRLGCDVTILPRFDAEAMLALIERHRIEHVQLVPTMLTRLLALAPEVRARYDVGSLRSVVHAAAPCPPDVKRAVIDWWGPIVSEYYGGTEVGIVVKADTAQWLAHPGTVGRPVQDAAVRVLDANGEEVSPGETGEVYLRPPSCWPDFTYQGLADQRAAIDRDGFVTLGDIGRVDVDGFLYLTDRSKDMVISGGVNIYPAEVEACLMELEGVRDVAVFGVPDADWGEALVAHVERAEGAPLDADAVQAHVRARLAGYKVPRRVVFEALPREDTGKLFKRRLRERYAKTSTTASTPSQERIA
jgi:long-chain acyl-CoA synthetase